MNGIEKNEGVAMNEMLAKGTRVFVTGGAGVIGMELVPRLVALGADVLVGDLKAQPEKFKGTVRYRHGDLNDLTSAEMLGFDPELIIHLAATFERSAETSGFWEENFRHNVTLSHHVMTLARNCHNLKRVVFASSYLIYDPSLYQFDTPQPTPRVLTEEDVIRPRNLTGMAKLAHEQELHFLSSFAECQFSTICVRIFRGYGRRSRDVISRWIRSLIKGESITVYCPEGSFDYVYAADSAEGLVRLAMCETAKGIINLGTGQSRRVADVIQILQGQFPSASIEYEKSDIPYEASQACTQKLQAFINWKPSRTLEQTIPEIISFEREQLQQPLSTVKTRAPLRSILVTSASRKIPLLKAIKDAACRIDPNSQVIAGDTDPMAVARFIADQFWQMPSLDDGILDELIEGCLSRSITVVFPTRDGELDFWARHRVTFAKVGVEVIISSLSSIARCRDKLAFASFGSDCNLPMIPASITPELFSLSNLVVKERFGAGSRGLGLDLPLDEAIKHSRDLHEPIFQPFVNGPEISIDGWADRHGNVRGVVLRWRDRVVSGESQVTTTFRDAKLEDQAIRVLNALQLCGPVVLQAIVVGDELQVIECNPRFGGASTTSIAAGLDSLYWSLAEALGDSTVLTFKRSSGEIRQIRIPVDCLIHGTDF
jgi:carbamoyl-phosphate synthase large subunit